MIKNESKKTVIANNFLYKTGLSKMVGLLFKQEVEAIVFRTRFGIHTFLMSKPFDLIVLNKRYEVVFIKESVKPNRVILWNPKYDIVLELPAGSVNNSKTGLGDKLNLKL